MVNNNEELIENFDKNFYEILKEEKKYDKNLFWLIENSPKSFDFSDLMLLKENDSEDTNKIKREILNKTEFAQPAILLHSYLNYRKFLKEKSNIVDELKEKGAFFFGPSLGEIISLVCAKSISLDKAGVLLYKRGKFMQESCPKGKGAMLNVIGDINKNINLFKDFIENENNKNEVLNISSIMSKRLIVISGATDSIEKCKNFFKENSVGCRKLIVSAAFHSSLMKQGSENFKNFLFNQTEKNENIFFDFPEISIISTIYPEFIYYKKQENSLNKIEFDKKVKELLVDQFTRKVNLLESIDNFVKINHGIEFDLYDIVKRKKVDLNDYL